MFGMRPLIRATPALPPNSYKTYQIAAPLPTHYRFASCEEVDCAAYRLGWRTVVDEDKARLARHSGRKYTETRDPAGLVVFDFPAGQRCFRQPPPRLLGRDVNAEPAMAGRVHVKPLERPELFLVGAGDHRMYHPRAAMRHSGPDAWLDDFATHQELIAAQVERG